MTLPDFLTSDEFDNIRLKGHNISLFDVLWHYREGYSAEILKEFFPTLSMAVIHKTLAFYWENVAELDAYVLHCDAQLAELEARLPHVDLAELRARLATQNKPSLAG